MNISPQRIKTMNTEILQITPDVAKTLLTMNTKNRPPKPAQVEFLCSELIGKRWKFNGDTIRVASDGTLLDGQHRLLAVVKTGIPICAILVKDLDPAVFSTIDTGATRSAGDALAICGEKNGRNLAAAVIVAVELLDGKTDFARDRKISNSETLEMLTAHPEIRKSMHWGTALSRKLPPSVSVALHYVFSKRNAVKADLFFRDIVDGVGLAADNPVYWLRQRLIDNLASKGKLSRRYLAALVIKSWNAYVVGQKVKSLRFRESGDYPEDFPSIR